MCSWLRRFAKFGFVACLSLVALCQPSFKLARRAFCDYFAEIEWNGQRSNTFRIQLARDGFLRNDHLPSPLISFLSTLAFNLLSFQFLSLLLKCMLSIVVCCFAYCLLMACTNTDADIHGSLLTENWLQAVT